MTKCIIAALTLYRKIVGEYIFNIETFRNLREAEASSAHEQKHQVPGINLQQVSLKFIRASYRYFKNII